MTTSKPSEAALLTTLEETVSNLMTMISSFTESELNAVPFEGSWSGGQVTEHVIKVNESMTRSLCKQGRSLEREPDKRATELKDLFMNFEDKRKAPESVRPAGAGYKKEVLTADLKYSIDQLKQAASSADLSEAIDSPSFGELSKFEIVTFSTYHTQRHIQQLKNIQQALAKN